MAESRRRSASPPLNPQSDDQVPLVSAQSLEDDPRGLKRKEPPSRPRFKVVGHLVLAMQRFKGAWGRAACFDTQSHSAAMPMTWGCAGV